MNSDFVIVDRLNCVAFQCYPLVRFVYDNNDYLIYYSCINDKKCKVFTSKIAYSGNNKYNLKDISIEEKNRIANVVYAVVITFPSSYSKNLDVNKFVNDFSFNNNIKFSKEIPKLGEQLLYNNSFFAVSEIDYIAYTKSFYNYILSRVVIVDKRPLVWSIPNSGQSISINRLDNSLISNTSNVIISSDENNYMPNLDVIIPISGFETKKNEAGFDVNNNMDSSSFDFGFNYNPDTDDISLANSDTEDNFLDKKNAGFASNQYIIIGTVCLILSAIVVAVSIVIMKNLF